MEVLLLGIATAFNFIILKWKYERKRYEDMTLDIIVLGILSWLFGGTITGLAIAMIASMIVSFYLLIYPPNLTSKEKSDD